MTRTNYPDQHTDTRRQLLREAQRDARHAADATRRHHDETSEILLVLTYGIGIFLICLLIVLLATPTPN